MQFWINLLVNKLLKVNQLTFIGTKNYNIFVSAAINLTLFFTDYLENVFVWSGSSVRLRQSLSRHWHGSTMTSLWRLVHASNWPSTRQRRHWRSSTPPYRTRVNIIARRPTLSATLPPRHYCVSDVHISSQLLVLFKESYLVCPHGRARLPIRIQDFNYFLLTFRQRLLPSSEWSYDNFRSPLDVAANNLSQMWESW